MLLDGSSAFHNESTVSISYRFREHRAVLTLVKTEKKLLLLSIVHTATGDISDDFFQMQKSGKVNNHEPIISPNCRQIRKLFIPKSKHSAGARRSVLQFEAKSDTISLYCIWGPRHWSAKYSWWDFRFLRRQIWNWRHSGDSAALYAR
jgi:hypothetical protein